MVASTLTPLAVLAASLAFLGVLLAAKGRRTVHEAFNPSLYRAAEFPEGRYRSADPEAFRAQVERGYSVMSRSSVVFCGITRNDEAAIPLTIRRLERSAAAFRTYRVVIFENGSSDRTPALLREWASRDPNVTVLSDDDSYSHGERFERLARCRNAYVDFLNGTPELRDVDYVIVVDFDLHGGWSRDGLASTFAEEGWDAVGSNSLGYHGLRLTYYDTAALRPPSVLDHTGWYRVFGEGWRWKRGMPMFPVHSAFGGLAVYRRGVFASRRYSGTFENAPACEHLSLNLDGALRVFLNPSQITVVGSQTPRALLEAMPAWHRNLHLLLRNW